MDYKEEFIKATKVLIALCFVTVGIQFFFGSSCTWRDVKEWCITNSLFSYPFYFANAFLILALDKWLPWKENVRKRAVVGTLTSIVVNLIVIMIVITLVAVYVHGGEANYIFTTNGKNNVLITFIIVTVITLIFYAVGFFKEYQKELLLNEELRREKISAELNALKAQVDPHFLFNSFNVLSGLIDENPGQAQKFLSGLSKIYRYVLEKRDEELVTLSEELSFARQYLDLQKIRFENGIHLDLDVDATNLEKKLPALSLQLLLENAITHNGFDASSPLRISIAASDGALVVSNNKQSRKKLNPGSGLGLKNITDRYSLHKVQGFSIQDNVGEFIVQLPLISV